MTTTAEPTIYHIDEAELHMIGRYVAVRWNTSEEKQRIKGEDGKTYTALVTIRDSDGPYISFANVRKYGDEYYLKGNSIDGGISVTEAEQVIKELQWAVEYIGTIVAQVQCTIYRQLPRHYSTHVATLTERVAPQKGERQVDASERSKPVS